MPKKKTSARKPTPKTQTLTLKQIIHASPIAVSRMFTHATALRDWLSDGADVDPVKGGMFLLRWNVGGFVGGQFTTFEPGSKLVMSWYGRGLPGEMRLTLTFKPGSDDTLLTFALSGIGTGREWKGVYEMEESFWKERLETLKSVLETGIDLRVANRPRLGLGYDMYTPEFGNSVGVPSKIGLRVMGTAEGTGAHALGLVQNDVLVKFNGKPVNNSLEAGMQGLKVGDSAPVEWYRGAQKMKGVIKLGSFPPAPVPPTAAELAATMRQTYAELDKLWEDNVSGLSETQADYHDGDAWSVKELIAHFIGMQRDYQSWLASMLQDNPINDTLEMRPAAILRLRAMVNRFKTTAALIDELKASEAETLDLIASLPDSFVSNHHYYLRAVTLQLEVIPFHMQEEHGEQIANALAAARKQ